MAVEARHLNLFSPQHLGNRYVSVSFHLPLFLLIFLLHLLKNLTVNFVVFRREIMNPIEPNINLYNAQMGFSSVPLSGTTTETLIPAYNSLIVDSIPPKTAMKSDSGVTYNIPHPRKRSRDSINPYLSYPASQSHKNCGVFSFLGQDISLQIQHQQLDFDRLITQHVSFYALQVRTIPLITNDENFSNLILIINLFCMVF